jgi:hypothetical protein
MPGVKLVAVTTALSLLGSLAQAQQTCQKINNVTYCHDASGNTTTYQQLGNFTYGHGSDGSSSTCQRIGNTTYCR